MSIGKSKKSAPRGVFFNPLHLVKGWIANASEQDGVVYCELSSRLPRHTSCATPSASEGELTPIVGLDTFLKSYSSDSLSPPSRG